MSEEKIYENVCVCCGANFRTRVKRNHCPICKAAIDKLGAWLAENKEMPPDDELQIMFQAYRKSALTVADKKDGATKTPRYDPTVKNLAARCLFCGRPLGTAFDEYCASCRREGFANVHKITGRTNGWDKSYCKNGKRFDRRIH